jgi:hypothetical protein
VFALPLAVSAQTYVMDFENDAMGMMIEDGSDVSTAYMDWGVHFTNQNMIDDPINHHNGLPYATNANTLATSTDTGIGYDPTMGNVLNAYGDLFSPGWSEVDGDPMLHVMFDRPVSSISVDFIGDTDEMSHLMVFDGMMEVEHIHITRGGGAAVRNETLTYSGSMPFTMAMLGVGSRTDWVGIDNIRFTFAPAPVPEPGSVALAGSILACSGLMLRRSRK